MVRVVCASLAVAFLAVAFVACSPGASPIYCTPDETMCHGSCSALYKDPANCGACESACPSGLVCSQGTCATNCGGGTIQCGDLCVQVKVDRDNCGVCGKACGAGEVCVNATCSTKCAPSQKMCLEAIAPYCAATQSDNRDCGGCGVACATEESCIQGVCTSACAVSQTLCFPTTDHALCTDLTSDVNNCGKCGTACPQHAYCDATVNPSKCACPNSQTVCGGACVDTDTDISNCGGCGKKCNGSCDSGKCAVSIATLSGGEGKTLVLDTSHVYWVQTNDYLYSGSKNGTAHDLLSTNATLGSLTVDASDIYWPSSTSVDLVPIGGGTQATQSMPSTENAAYVVADGTSVYVAHPTGIVSFPSGGGSNKAIVTGEPAPHSLATASGVLYWANDSYQVRRAKTDGTGLLTLATMSAPVGQVVTDGQNVYFVWKASELLAVPADGSGTPLVLVSGLSSVSRIATDGTNVYWIDATAISSVPVGGGTPKALVTTSDAADLAVDTTSLYWTSSTDVMKLTPK